MNWFLSLLGSIGGWFAALNWTVIPVSALVSALVVFLTRLFDRKKPRLTLVETPVKIPQGMNEDLYGRIFRLTNEGNGVAYDVRFVGSNCVVGTRNPYDDDSWVNHVASINPGSGAYLEMRNSIEDCAIVADIRAQP